MILLAAVLAQQLATLHIKVTLTADAARGPVPIARAALLVSDEPSTAAPQRVVTGPDGTADIRLRPGTYIVESDEPVAFGGRGYEWRQTVRVARADVVLELTAANAEAATTAPTSTDDNNTLLTQWRDSLVAIWTAESRASGFLVNADGLIATNQRIVGTATSVELQISPSVKIAARVLAADRARDVAILWIDAADAKTLHPIPLTCAAGADSAPAIAKGQKLIALGSPLRGPKEESPGDVTDTHPVVADFRLADGSMGGPIFNGSALVGLSSIVDDARRDARVVSVDNVCAVVAAAEKTMKTSPPPSASRLPVESERPINMDALDAVVKTRQGSLNPYQVSSSNFDVVFLTPVIVRGAQQLEAARGRIPQRTAIVPTDFGEWSNYFDDVPPVVVVRVTPKMAEGFWTSVGRAAAYTQGVAIPSIKHFKPGFARLRAYCGDAEATPIHPFTLTHLVTDTDAVREGLYVFDPQTIGSQCASVKLVMYSEKDPNKPDALVVDPQILERIAADLRPR